MRLATLLLCLLPPALSACAERGYYPLSGDVCGPSDPVQQMNSCDLTAFNFLPQQSAP